MTATIVDRPLESMVCNTEGVGLCVVLFVPWGRIRSKSGEFIIDAESALSIINAFNAHATEIPVDIEHESLPGREPPTGSRGAVGWIVRLWATPGAGLYGAVRWTEHGLSLIRSGAFGYISPVLLVRKSDRRAVELHSAGVTTKPAIGGMERLAASARLANNANGDGMMTIEEVKRFITERIVTDEWDDLDAPGVLDMLAERMIEFFGAAATESEAMAEHLSPDALAFKEKADALELQIAERELGEKIGAYVACGAIHENDEVYASMLHFARQDWDKAQPVLERLKRQFVPPQGRTTPPKRTAIDGRHAVIANAAREFQNNPAHGRVTSLRAFVNCALRDRSLAVISDDEAKELAIK